MADALPPGHVLQVPLLGHEIGSKGFWAFLTTLWANQGEEELDSDHTPKHLGSISKLSNRKQPTPAAFQ